MRLRMGSNPLLDTGNLGAGRRRQLVGRQLLSVSAREPEEGGPPEGLQDYAETNRTISPTGLHSQGWLHRQILTA